MHGDKLIIALGSAMFALSTKAVAGIMEYYRIPFLPGQARFVTGIISFRNEPVAVVDARSALGLPEDHTQSSHKIIVLSEKGHTLGIDIGEAEVSFVWDEEIEAGDGGCRGPYTCGSIKLAGGAIGIIDWQAIFNETSTILSAGVNA